MWVDTKWKGGWGHAADMSMFAVVFLFNNFEVKICFYVWGGLLKLDIFWYFAANFYIFGSMVIN